MRDGNEWVLVGEKTYISNGGIADFYVTFARTGEGEGARGLSAFIVPADAGLRSPSGSTSSPRTRSRGSNTTMSASRPTRSSASRARASASRMETLTLFRVTVGAAALGFARRALDEALGFRDQPPARQRHARRQCGDPGEARRHGARDRCLGAADLPRRLAAGRRRDRQPPRRGHGQAPRDRSRAAGDRRGGADARRRRRHQRRQGRGAVPRYPRAAHLRRRERSAAPDHRPRPAEGVRP